MTTPTQQAPLTDDQKRKFEAAAKEKWESARTRLVLQRPFYASLALGRPPKVDWDCDTAWTDGRNFGYNPKYVAELEDDEVLGLNVHEVSHISLKHHLRKGDRDHDRWNVATDAAINRLAELDGFTLPPGGIPAWPTPDSAEEIYPHIPPQPKGGGGGGGVEVRDMKNPDGSELSPAQAKIEDQKVNDAVARAINTAKAAGKLPAGMEIIVEATTSRVPWREILAEFLSQFAKNDYSWQIVDKRQIGNGFIFPSLYSEEQGRICFTGDTSGSQSMEQLQMIASELLWQVEQMTSSGQEAELTVCWWDTDVYVQRITSAEDIKPRGGGGTDAAKMFEWVAGRLQVKDPQGDVVEPGECLACVVMTDGYIGGFGNDPGIPVLWILTCENRSFDPPFGRVAWTIDED